jgi:hypothetical protein
MPDKKSIYGKTTKDYLEQIGKMDLRGVSEKKGAGWEQAGVRVPLLGQSYTISRTGILDSSGAEPDHAVRVVLCRYLLHENPNGSDSGEWASYREFPDAAPLVEAFRNNAERAVADDFAGRMEDLERMSKKLGGYGAPVDGSYDLKIRFDALPMVPVLLLFNDADEEFPAKCVQLFQKRAEKYLDMESLAILGWVLADYLRGLRHIAEDQS